VENELLDIVEGSATSETKEETICDGVTSGSVGALTTIVTFAPTDRESRMMGMNVYRLAPYQGAARYERPSDGSIRSS
jgi:hypothetical protein